MGNDISIRDAATIVNANLNAQISSVTCIVWVVIMLCLKIDSANPILQVVACIAWLCEVIHCIRERAKVRYLVCKINDCEEGQ